MPAANRPLGQARAAALAMLINPIHDVRARGLPDVVLWTAHTTKWAR